MRRRQALLDGVFVAAEAVVWFMVIRVLATSAERSFRAELEQRIVVAEIAREIDASAAARALDVLRGAMDAPAGPPLLLVILAAGMAFAGMRVLHRSGLDAGVGAVVLLAGSVVALNIVLHLALAGSVRFWDASGLVRFFSTPGEYFAAGMDLQAFVRDPKIGGAHGSAITIVVVGMTLMWLRFVIGARATVTFDRVTRSFGLGFVAVLLITVVAAASGQGGLALYAVPHFILGAFGLAVANQARAVPTDGERREVPWMTAVGATVAALIGGALLFSAAIYLNVGALVDIAGTIALRAFEISLAIVVYPLFWILEPIVRWILPDVDFDIWERLSQFQLLQPNEEQAQEVGRRRLPGPVVNLLQFALVLGIGWMAYRLTRLLFGRKRSVKETVEASGGVASMAPAGFREVLRDLLPGGGRERAATWVNRQAIYRLYARVVRASYDRGLRPLPGETPIEFSATAARMLDGPSLGGVGVAFDRARYGRHLPAEGEVAALARQVEEWERAVPASDEIRERVAGARPISPADELEVQVALSRQEQSRRRIHHLDP